MWLGLFSEYAGSTIANKEATRDSKNAANFVFPPMRQAKFSRLAHIYLQGFTFRLLMSLGMEWGYEHRSFSPQGQLCKCMLARRFCLASGTAWRLVLNSTRVSRFRMSFQ